METRRQDGELLSSLPLRRMVATGRKILPAHIGKHGTLISNVQQIEWRSLRITIIYPN